MKKMDRIIVYLQYKGGAIWRVKKQSHISISKAPGALFRENTVIVLKIIVPILCHPFPTFEFLCELDIVSVNYGPKSLLSV